MVLMHQTRSVLFLATRQSVKSGHSTVDLDGRMPRRKLAQAQTSIEVKIALCTLRIRFREGCCRAGRIGDSRSDHAHCVNCLG